LVDSGEQKAVKRRREAFLSRLLPQKIKHNAGVYNIRNDIVS
jgi:hypothetical protein